MLAILIGFVTLTASVSVTSDAQTANVDRWSLEAAGFYRFRGNVHSNFDLNDTDKRDDLIRFFDARSYLNLKAKKKAFSALLSLDLAGNEFNDGAIFGNDQPPYTFLRATKAQPEGTGPLGPGLGALSYGPASGQKTKDVGWEVDLLIDYEWIKQIKSLVYCGFFSPGKIYGTEADKAFKVEVGMEYKL